MACSTHVRMWNDLPSSVFDSGTFAPQTEEKREEEEDSGTLSGFKGAVNLSLLP